MARLVCDILESIFSDLTSGHAIKTLRAMALKSPGSFHDLHKEFDISLYKNK